MNLSYQLIITKNSVSKSYWYETESLFNNYGQFNLSQAKKDPEVEKIELFRNGVLELCIDKKPVKQPATGAVHTYKIIGIDFGNGHTYEYSFLNYSGRNIDIGHKIKLVYDDNKEVTVSNWYYINGLPSHITKTLILTNEHEAITKIIRRS